MADFVISQRCTIPTVNLALKTAGYGDVEIIYDVENWHRVTVEHICYDEHDQPYISSERTNLKTARAWAKQFADGRL